jgi:hypothetical protein
MCVELFSLRQAATVDYIGCKPDAVLETEVMVRMGRLELPRPCERWNLNPVRLPIPPHPHGGSESFSA